MKKINNEVLLEKINNIGKIQEIEFCYIRKELKEIREHLEKVNGETVKNTKHRISQQTINKIMGTVLVIILTGLVTLTIKILT